MISGIVTSNNEASIRFHIADGSGQSQPIDAIIDTGFAGFMSLPITNVAVLGVPWIFRDRVQLIDGRVILVDIFSAIAIWNGKTRMINVQALGTYNLIGMRMLAAHDLQMRIVDGGTVMIDAVP
jgi:clan AA aspartic protease